MKWKYLNLNEILDNAGLVELPLAVVEAVKNDDFFKIFICFLSLYYFHPGGDISKIFYLLLLGSGSGCLLSIILFCGILT